MKKHAKHTAIKGNTTIPIILPKPLNVQTKHIEIMGVIANKIVNPKRIERIKINDPPTVSKINKTS